MQSVPGTCEIFEKWRILQKNIIRWILIHNTGAPQWVSIDECKSLSYDPNSRDSKDNELWGFNRYFSKIADLPPNILSEIRWKSRSKRKFVQSY